MAIAVADARVEVPHLVIEVCPNWQGGADGKCACPEGAEPHPEFRYAADPQDGLSEEQHDAKCAAEAVARVERETALVAGAGDRHKRLVGKGHAALAAAAKPQADKTTKK